MPGTMSRADLVQDLRGVLMDAAAKFTAEGDADFARHLDIAALDLGRVRPRTLIGSLTLVADQPNYAAPAELVAPQSVLWGGTERRRRQPWDADWPGAAPRLRLAENAGTRELWLDPPPTAAQISAFGSTFKFFYRAGYAVGEQAVQTTVPASDRALLLVRATAQALGELANHSVTKPVQLGDGFGAAPKTGTPAALAEAWLKTFEKMVA